MKKLTLLFILNLFTILPSVSFSQENTLIASGPMNGYSTMREALVWIQTKESATVKIEYWDSNLPDVTYFSNSVITEKDHGFTAHLIADELEPGITYSYSIWINGKKVETKDTYQLKSQPLWQYRTDPPAFTLAIGSCAYINEEKYDRPGKPYGSNYKIFNTINETNPDLMLWLGDNIYLREPDFDSKTGIYKRYTHTRATPELKQLLANTHHYAIWDDHDFGPNDSYRSYPLKNHTLQAFKDFWGNKYYGINDKPGITSSFKHVDIDFYLLDNRYYRTSRNRITGDKFIVGDEQIEWLIDELKFSRAPFKMVAIGGQFLNDAAVHENHAQFAEERQKIIDLIVKEKITGVVFLTGDRHHTELSMLTKDNITIYDLTVSPLTSGTHFSEDEKNSYRVENTAVSEHNFGLLEFSGERKNRTLKIKIHNKEGKLLWEKSITHPKRP